MTHDGLGRKNQVRRLSARKRGRQGRGIGEVRKEPDPEHVGFPRARIALEGRSTIFPRTGTHTSMCHAVAPVACAGPHAPFADCSSSLMRSAITSSTGNGRRRALAVLRRWIERIDDQVRHRGKEGSPRASAICGLPDSAIRRADVHDVTGRIRGINGDSGDPPGYSRWNEDVLVQSMSAGGAQGHAFIHGLDARFEGSSHDRIPFDWNGQAPEKSWDKTGQQGLCRKAMGSGQPLAGFLAPPITGPAWGVKRPVGSNYFLFGELEIQARGRPSLSGRPPMPIPRARRASGARSVLGPRAGRTTRLGAPTRP